MDLKKENKRLEAWIDDLQSGMYINCVYCGHRYGPDDDVKIPMRGQLEKHIEQCPKHPLSKAKAELSTLRSELEKAKSDIVFMVNKAADNHLEGYRELGRRAAEAENKRDRLRAANRELVEVCKAWIEFQCHYQIATSDKFPGNEHWQQEAMAVVEKTMVAIAKNESEGGGNEAYGIAVETLSGEIQAGNFG
jgi:hypothetical protein